MKALSGIAIAGLLLLVLGAGCAQQEKPPVETPPSGVTPIPPSPQAGPEIPTLTAEQEAQVKDIIAGDPTLRQVLNGRTYSVDDMGPWVGDVDPETGDYLLIGATAKVTLSEPLPRVEIDWPYKVGRPYYHLWPPELQERFPSPYREGTQRFTVQNLSEMYVQVDLDRAKLVEIIVLDLPDGQQVTYPPVPTPEPVPGGEELAREVFAADERVQAILAGRDYWILAISTAAHEGSRLASVIVQWDDPEDIEADWPLPIDLDEETGAYEVHTIHFTAETVGRLDVLIDLDKQQVITIEPSVGD